MILRGPSSGVSAVTKCGRLSTCTLYHEGAATRTMVVRILEGKQLCLSTACHCLRFKIAAPLLLSLLGLKLEPLQVDEMGNFIGDEVLDGSNYNLSGVFICLMQRYWIVEAPQQASVRVTRSALRSLLCWFLWLRWRD